jgi:hypothetical protein
VAHSRTQAQEPGQLRDKVTDRSVGVRNDEDRVSNRSGAQAHDPDNDPVEDEPDEDADEEFEDDDEEDDTTDDETDVTDPRAKPRKPI